MPSYRPPISIDQYHNLEVYRYHLVQLTGTAEFRDMKSQKQDKILAEVNYMNVAINILEHLFSFKHGKERSVIAWQMKPTDRVVTAHRFSCIKVAARCLDCNKSKISAVCKGKRPQTGGYHFAYEDEYDYGDHLTFDPNSTKFEFK